MDPREKIVNLLDELPNYKVVGGYSITREAKNNIEVRETKDLDLRLCSNLQANYNIDDLVSVLNQHKIPTRVEKTTNGQYRVIATVSGTNVKIDIEFKDGSDISGKVKNINESLRDKFYLAMQIRDRSFKNVVDVITCLRSDYKDGITKQEFLEIVGSEGIHRVDEDTFLKLASKFKPETLDGISMQEHALWFSTLVDGLISDGISSGDVFKDGKWYYGA